MTASKSAKIWDLFGLLTPVLAGVKCLMRETVRQTEDWDSPISSELQNKWLKEFIRIDNLRGISFTRPVMPINAINNKLRLIGLGDASKIYIVTAVYGGFELPDGTFSCSLIIGRGMLAGDITIPKLELNGQCATSNIGWVIRSALIDWPTT